MRFWCCAAPSKKNSAFEALEGLAPLWQKVLQSLSRSYSVSSDLSHSESPKAEDLAEAGPIPVVQVSSAQNPHDDRYIEWFPK